MHVGKTIRPEVSGMVGTPLGAAVTRDEFTPPKRHGSVRIDASRRRGPRATARVRRRETTRAPCPAFGARAGSAPRDGNFAGGDSRARRALRHRFRGTGGFARQEARPGEGRHPRVGTLGVRGCRRRAHGASRDRGRERQAPDSIRTCFCRSRGHPPRRTLQRLRATDRLTLSSDARRLTRRTRLSGFASC